MMKALFSTIGLSLIINTGVASTRLDLSQAHNKETITSSGVSFRDVDDKWLAINAGEDIKLIFPGGREIEFRVNRGDFTYHEDGKISYASLYTMMMPAEEAAEVMRTFMQSIGQPTNDVDRWLREVKEGKNNQVFAFDDLATGTGWKHYPGFSLRAKNSYNPTYPWELSLMIKWSPRRYPDGWDEEKAAIHNPKPPDGFERISLNPPSGRFYDGREGWEKHLGVDLDAQAQLQDTPPVDATSPDADSPTPPRPAIEKQYTVPSPEQNYPFGWLWILLFLIFLAAILWFMRRR